MTTYDIPAAVRRAREAAGLSQTDIHRKTGIACSTISLWESGGRSPLVEGLIEMADALDISLDDLVGRQRPQPHADCLRFIVGQTSDATTLLNAMIGLEMGREEAMTRRKVYLSGAS